MTSEAIPLTENKAMQFWATMRSTNHLFQKSNLPTESDKAQLENQLRDILGKRKITYPQTLRRYGIGHETPYETKKILLGVDFQGHNQEYIINEIKFLQFMNNKASQAQKGNWSWRIKQEAEQKQEAGWYPFFVTLTIDPKKCDGRQHYDYNQLELPIYNSPRELWEKGREFRKYIRRLANVAALELGHPPPHKKNKQFGYRPESDYITYAAVIEHGKS